MELAPFLTGVIISAIISGFFSESIVQGLGLLLSKIDLPKHTNIEGIWNVQFTREEGNSVKIYCETIKVVKRLGIIYGYNIPNANNHDLLKQVEEKKPKRIRGNMVDNRFFTGIWYHPNKKARFHGSYQLLCSLSGDTMNGTWTGYSETTNSIESGSWVWKKEKE